MLLPITTIELAILMETGRCLWRLFYIFLNTFTVGLTQEKYDDTDINFSVFSALLIMTAG